ncbi:MAG TPA: ribonuclease HII [Candidatus Binataceae bacterium]|nr:ribonuclease HII [Candidatus Binataceae bacterium]
MFFRALHNGREVEEAGAMGHPSLRYERKLWREGVQVVAGVDEAGVGPMAGPVVAAAVIFEPEVFIKGVNDSKQLTAERREELFPKIQERAIAIGVGIAHPGEVDLLNIYWATMAASERALYAMGRKPDHVLVDGRLIPELKMPQTKIVGGDRKSFCIAAASIIAKVTRDRMMAEYDAQYPEFGFARHKGYCTPDHMAVLERLGPTPIHRRSFAPVWEAAQRRLF